MAEQILRISEFIMNAFLHIWPYLLVTIPLAVAVQMSGASKYIKRAFVGRPLAAILMATAVGAFSPFCSCGVIPVIAALLISGVPLAPVMSFWIASPSMDPEIFFLSVGTIGWNLAVWRLLATLVLSLSAGFITHLMVQKNWIGQEVLRNRKIGAQQRTSFSIQKTWHGLKNRLEEMELSRFVPGYASRPPVVACCNGTQTVLADLEPVPRAAVTPILSNRSIADPPKENCGCGAETIPFWRRLLKESFSATQMVVKFMLLAFFLEALIILYVPSDWIAGLLGQENQWAILIAALLGVPTYTSNLAALPMMSGLLAQGMNPAAALAFLIAGPTTTLPAMAAVWSLVSHRVFGLYVSFSLVGAIALGYAKLILG